MSGFDYKSQSCERVRDIKIKHVAPDFRCFVSATYHRAKKLRLLACSGSGQRGKSKWISCGDEHLLFSNRDPSMYIRLLILFVTVVLATIASPEPSLMIGISPKPNPLFGQPPQNQQAAKTPMRKPHQQRIGKQSPPSKNLRASGRTETSPSNRWYFSRCVRLLMLFAPDCSLLKLIL